MANKTEQPQTPPPPETEKPSHGTALPVLEIPDVLTVKDLASMMDVVPIDVIKQLMRRGSMLAVNDVVDQASAADVASDYGYEVKALEKQEEESGSLVVSHSDEDETQLQPRPPVVAILGHVDHGKTTLLDAIRDAKVVEGEAGGITQHIGAYQIDSDGRQITFLDTPGHEAFTAMRARGARVTDIAVLVVAADDGIMPQTLEAIDHIRAAGATMLVAINKVDRPEADPDRLKRQLAEQDLLVEEWGGDVIAIPVSAIKGEGISDLLDNISVLAELSELTANPNRPAEGVIVEARVDKNKGPLATLLVQNGTLKTGDYIVSGAVRGRVKAMFDDSGKPIQNAEPSTPVEILGLGGVPEAGETLTVVPNDKAARALVEMYQEEGNGVSAAVRLEELYSRMESGEVKGLNLIVKTDVQGTIDAVRTALEGLNSEETRVNIVRSASGSITESDIMLASASSAIVLGFNTGPEPGAATLAKQKGTEIRTYDVIYRLIEDVAQALHGLLAPVTRDVLEGYATVRAIFNVARGSKAAGVYVNDGSITRGAEIRVMRNNRQAFAGQILSLKHFKDDVRELTAGLEGGIVLEGFNDPREGDVLEAHRTEIE